MLHVHVHVHVHLESDFTTAILGTLDTGSGSCVHCLGILGGVYVSWYFHSQVGQAFMHIHVHMYTPAVRTLLFVRQPNLYVM